MEACHLWSETTETVSYQRVNPIQWALNRADFSVLPSPFLKHPWILLIGMAQFLSLSSQLVLTFNLPFRHHIYICICGPSESQLITVDWSCGYGIGGLPSMCWRAPLCSLLRLWGASQTHASAVSKTANTVGQNSSFSGGGPQYTAYLVGTHQPGGKDGSLKIGLHLSSLEVCCMQPCPEATSFTIQVSLHCN
jgi:hypothetical protein